jgi:hypothetical protein
MPFRMRPRDPRRTVTIEDALARLIEAGFTYGVDA